MKWEVPEIWKDGEVWIIGGGYSMIEILGIPEELVEKVYNRELPISVYSPYFYFLEKKHVIAINVAFMLGDWVDIVFFGDSEFYHIFNKQLQEFEGLRVTCSKIGQNSHLVKYLEKDSSKEYGITLDKKKVVWNFNSGVAAINLAIHTGARRILLLGFDMKVRNGKKHWHNEYNLGVLSKEKDLINQSLIFDRYRKSFKYIKEDLERYNLKVEILNVNYENTIEEFKTVSLKEVL